MVQARHVQEAFDVLRLEGISPNGPSTKWDIVDPKTNERFPPKAVLRVAKRLAGDESALAGGGWPTNDPLVTLGFDIVLKKEPAPPGVEKDIREIRKTDADETTKTRLINARLGQGSFREALLETWEYKCALTGCDFEPLLRASHIKPWRNATNSERLDPANGLLLAAQVDALFDRYLLSFSDDGNVLVASRLTKALLLSIGIRFEMKPSIKPANLRYLEWHRDSFHEVSKGEYYEL